MFGLRIRRSAKSTKWELRSKLSFVYRGIDRTAIFSAIDRPSNVESITLEENSLMSNDGNSISDYCRQASEGHHAVIPLRSEANGFGYLE